MRVHKARDDRAPTDIPAVIRLGCPRGRADPSDESVLNDDRSVAQAAQVLRVVGAVQQLVVGDELGDTGEQRRGHDFSQIMSFSRS